MASQSFGGGIDTLENFLHINEWGDETLALEVHRGKVPSGWHVSSVVVLAGQEKQNGRRRKEEEEKEEERERGKVGGQKGEKRKFSFKKECGPTTYLYFIYRNFKINARNIKIKYQIIWHLIWYRTLKLMSYGFKWYIIWRVTSHNITHYLVSKIWFSFSKSSIFDDLTITIGFSI